MNPCSPASKLLPIKPLLADGRNIPDEFILEVLKNNGNDLNRSYEDLQLRLERKNRTSPSILFIFRSGTLADSYLCEGSSWESVDEKSKKKKAEKQQVDSWRVGKFYLLCCG
jgi:hypothetical protein